jgi:hypothetical protein
MHGKPEQPNIWITLDGPFWGSSIPRVARGGVKSSTMLATTTTLIVFYLPFCTTTVYLTRYRLSIDLWAELQLKSVLISDGNKLKHVKWNGVEARNRIDILQGEGSKRWSLFNKPKFRWVWTAGLGLLQQGVIHFIIKVTVISRFYLWDYIAS